MTQGKRSPNPTCSVEGCEKKTRARGWCTAHWTMWRRHGDPLARKRFYRDDQSRFWSKVDPTGGLGACWPWLGKLTVDGYGQIATKWLNGRTSNTAHRFAYELFVGPIPDDRELDHVCHTIDRSCLGGVTCPHRRCANPLHLEAVTSGENHRRGRSPQQTGARQKAKTVCANGHPYDTENTYIHPVTGYRWCRQCRRERMRVAYRRRER